jgi:ADP-heptose:LPS heptosyltransferase
VRHEVDQVLDLVRLAGGTAVFRDLVVPVGARDRDAVGEVPSGGITLHLGRRWFSGGSTLASTIELLTDLRRFGVPVVATHGSDAPAEVEAVRAAGVADAVVGGLSFTQWAAVFEKSRVIVTVDTGATHVASAMRRPTVVLFEHRYFNLSSQEWSPYRVPAVCLRKPESSAPRELATLRESVAGAVETLLGTAAVF